MRSVRCGAVRCGFGFGFSHASVIRSCVPFVSVLFRFRLVVAVDRIVLTTPNARSASPVCSLFRCPTQFGSIRFDWVSAEIFGLVRFSSA